jgi:hypothetical protein
MMRIIGGNFKLSETIGIVLSDKSIFPLLHAHKDGVGAKTAPVSFSLVEDALDARFIFANLDEEKNSNIVYERISIPTKGFLNELIEVGAQIGLDQIARINIHNKFMGNIQSNPPHEVEINKLTFYYDISDLNEVDYNG